MPFRTLLRYRNQDLSSDLNHRLRDLVQKGVFYGGDVIPVASQLNVQVGNLGAVGSDGMVTLLEGSPETVAVQAGFSQWVLLRAVYVANDDPVAELEVLTETAFDALTDTEKAERIRLAKVTLSVTATEVTIDDISFTEADSIDPVARSKFRGSVATESALPDFTDPPTGVSATNREGDIYFIEDERVFYSWTVLGTPQWRAVVSAAEEVELSNHKNNEDDGTLAPDFYEAQHVLVKHRESLDDGTASLVQFGSLLGFDFGTGNAFVDANYPRTVVRRVDFTGLAAVTQVQLTGTYYVGLGSTGSATDYFRLVQYQDMQQLVGSDRRAIPVLRVLRADGLAELDPSADADDYGFYADPIVELNLTVTSDVSYTGNLSVMATLKRTAGTLELADFSIGDNGLGYTPLAGGISVVGAGFGTLSTAIDDVQEALDAIDSELGTQAALDQDVKDAIARIQNGAVYTADPDALSWYGGTGSAVGLLDDDGSNNPRVSAVSTDLLFKVPTGREFNWFIDTGVELTLTASLLQVNSALNVGGFVVGSPGDGIFTRGLRVGSDAAPTDNDIYAAGGINCGGSVNPAVGDGIFTDGLHVGSDTQPSDDAVTVGDASKQFGLIWDGTDGSVKFDNDDQLIYDRSGNIYRFQIATATEATIGTDGIRVLNGLHVGGLGTAAENDTISATGSVKAASFVFGIGASDDAIEFDDGTNLMSFKIDNNVELIIGDANISFQSNNITNAADIGCVTFSASNYASATNFLESPTWQVDATNTATWVADTSLTFTVASVDELVLTTSGLQVDNGLHVGDTTTTPTDNDISLAGGIIAGGTTDPGVGDGIFTGGLRVGTDAVATPGDIIASGGVTAGGVTNPSAGNGIFSGSVRIGSDAEPSTKLQIFTSAVGVFATNSDIVVEKAGDSFLNFMVTGEAGLIIGDAGDSDIGRFIYDHSSDSWQMFANNQNVLEVSSTTLVADVGQSVFGDSGAVDASAVLKCQSTTRGFLPPVMTTTEKNNISTPTAGLIVYDSTLGALQLYDGTWKTVTVT
jgi:hypothetical protein